MGGKRERLKTAEVGVRKGIGEGDGGGKLVRASKKMARRRDEAKVRNRDKAESVFLGGGMCSSDKSVFRPCLPGPGPRGGRGPVLRVIHKYLPRYVSARLSVAKYSRTYVDDPGGRCRGKTCATADQALFFFSCLSRTGERGWLVRLLRHLQQRQPAIRQGDGCLGTDWEASSIWNHTRWARRV